MRLETGRIVLIISLLASAAIFVGMPMITFASSHVSGGNDSKIFEGNVTGGQPLYDVLIKITPVNQTQTCPSGSSYADRTLTAGGYKFIVPATSLYPGDNTVRAVAYDEKGELIYTSTGTFTNSGNTSCQQPNQTEQWKEWRHEMFGELVRDSKDGVLRYPARNVPKREDVNREMRHWLIDNGYATQSQIGENEQLVTDIVALASQHDEILVWTLGDNLTQIINATNSTRLWVTRKDILQAMAAETGGISGTYLSCTIS
ncbi:MAG: hypothetical protein HYW25_04420 [Candidatus Aenigmarchaeota archaeon]|nr:hypothetical protein [Candidatus Aenigmarchaeota archaeon]